MCTEQCILQLHTIYTRNNMGQKCEGNCGLWVPYEILYVLHIKKRIVSSETICRNTFVDSGGYENVYRTVYIAASVPKVIFLQVAEFSG